MKENMIQTMAHGQLFPLEGKPEQTSAHYILLTVVLFPPVYSVNDLMIPQRRILIYPPERTVKWSAVGPKQQQDSSGNILEFLR